jgi:Myo-inositol oxygenase
MGRVKHAISNALERRGYQLRKIERLPDREFARQEQEIWDAHDAQTLDQAVALEEKYRAPVLGDMRVYDLVEMLSQCIDPMDKGLGTTSQLVHSLQAVDGLADAGVTDPDLVLAALLHDVGKLLLLLGEDPANVSSGNRPLAPLEPGAGFDACTFQWNHDEFGYSRFREHVPDHVAWLIRYHSAHMHLARDLMDERDRDYHDRYYEVFRTADITSKSAYKLPRTKLADHRELLEDTFPEPIPF